MLFVGTKLFFNIHIGHIKYKQCLLYVCRKYRIGFISDVVVYEQCIIRYTANAITGHLLVHILNSCVCVHNIFHMPGSSALSLLDNAKTKINAANISK